MIKKSFWLEEPQAMWVEKTAKKEKKTESEIARTLIESDMSRSPSLDKGK